MKFSNKPQLNSPNMWHRYVNLRYVISWTSPQQGMHFGYYGA